MIAATTETRKDRKKRNNFMQTSELVFRDLTDKILKCAIKVHKTLGPGFIERIYEDALAIEFNSYGIQYNKQKSINITYAGQTLGDQRLDFLVENEIIVELKAVSALDNIHLSQLFSYLKAAQKRVGLLLNFARPTFEIKRIIN